ncbi:PFAM Thioredoxin [Balamuthia mandrillaris]
MQQRSSVAGWTLVVLCGLCLAEAVLGSSVIVLDDKNFDRLVKDGQDEPWLIEFYAPWCGHCKKLAPAWEQLAQATKGRLKVAKVDVPANPELKKRMEIKGFPSILFFNKGEVRHYPGGRTVPEFIKFALEDGWKETEPGLARKAPSWGEAIMGNPTILIIMTVYVVTIAGVISCVCCCPSSAEEAAAATEETEETKKKEEAGKEEEKTTTKKRKDAASKNADTKQETGQQQQNKKAENKKEK